MPYNRDKERVRSRRRRALKKKARLSSTLPAVESDHALSVVNVEGDHRASPIVEVLLIFRDILFYLTFF